MKIGILTYHRSHNYGALLQAIALRKVLTDMGHNVTFIDYWPKYHRHTYAFFSFSAMKRENTMNRIKYVKNCVFYAKSRLNRITNFKRFIKEYILPFISTMDERYDVVIHGSDQIWRKQPDILDYNPIYFGKHNIRTKYKISYAASMGRLPQTDSERNKVAAYMGNLNHIGVRESDLRGFVSSLGYKCTIDIDPTLLLNGIQWRQIFKLDIPKGEKYLLYYNLLPNTFNNREIEGFANSNHLKLKIIYGHVVKRSSSKNITTANPYEFLRLLYNAECVITSSFHGLVFSILFHKPFFASFNLNPGRAQSVLEILHLENRLLSPNSSLPAEIGSINYKEVDEILSSFRQNSLNNLNKVLSEAEVLLK